MSTDAPKQVTVKPSDDQLVLITVTARSGQPLLKGRTIVCPLCEKEDDILSYIPLQYVEKYAEHLVVPLKCRTCRHVFSLRP